MPDDLQIAEAYVDLTLREDKLATQIDALRGRLEEQTAEPVPVSNYFGRHAEPIKDLGEQSYQASVRTRMLLGVVRIINPEMGNMMRGAHQASRAITEVGNASGATGQKLAGMVGRAAGIAAIGVAGGLAVAKLVELAWWYGVIDKKDRDRAANAQGIITAEQNAQRLAGERQEKLYSQLADANRLQQDARRVMEDVALLRMEAAGSSRLEIDRARVRLELERDLEEATRSTSRNAMPNVAEKTRIETWVKLYEAAMSKAEATWKVMTKRQEDEDAARRQREAKAWVADILDRGRQEREQREREAEKKRQQIQELAEFERELAYRQAIEQLDITQKMSREALSKRAIGAVSSAEALSSLIQGGPQDILARKMDALFDNAREQLTVQQEMRDLAKRRAAIMKQ